jgi:tetratricopeptide (TPR) repeat protein
MNKYVVGDILIILLSALMSCIMGYEAINGILIAKDLNSSDIIFEAVVSIVFLLVVILVALFMLRPHLNERAEFDRMRLNLDEIVASPVQMTEEALREPSIDNAPASADAPTTTGNPVVTREEALVKLIATKRELDILSAAGIDVLIALKLLELSNGSFKSGDYGRAFKYAEKASKVGKDLEERAKEENYPRVSAETAASQKEEAILTIRTVQSKLPLIKDGAEKTEIDYLLKLATLYVKRDAYSKALRYAKQADEKAGAQVE